MSTQEAIPRVSYYDYPEARRGPDVRYKNERKSNPALRGFTLVVAAFLFVTLLPLPEHNRLITQLMRPGWSG